LDIENPELDISQIDEVLNPSERDEFGNIKSEYKSPYGTAAKSLLGAYATVLTIKQGTKHLTPITQAITRPLRKASTTIKTFYSPEVQASKASQMDLVYKHWKGGELPGISRYLKEYKNQRDPFGIWWNEDIKVNKYGIMEKSDIVNKGNVSRFKNLLRKHGSALGIETADEMYFHSLTERGHRQFSELQYGPYYKGKDKELKRVAKILKYNQNQLRYEVQKTELMKQTFGMNIDKERWRKSGLGRVVNTDLKTALGNNDMAITSWTKGKFNPLTPETRVTASYMNQDSRMLIREAKRYGTLFDKKRQPLFPEITGPNQKFVRRYTKYGGIHEIAQDIFRLHEKGYNYKQVHAHYAPYRKYLMSLPEGVRYKPLNALDQLLNNYTFEKGVLKAPYAFTSQQKTIAGVNSNITYWRGKGISKLGKKDVKIDKFQRGYSGMPGGPTRTSLTTTPGKLHHKVFISDIYDVAGAPESMLKNVHINVASHDSRGGKYNSKEIVSRKPSSKLIASLMKNKEYKALQKILPNVSKRAAIKILKFLALKRL